MKSQSVRLLDVFFLGPFMMWTATRSRDLPTWARWTLGFFGASTIVYNARNYLEIERGRVP